MNKIFFMAALLLATPALAQEDPLPAPPADQPAPPPQQQPPPPPQYTPPYPTQPPPPGYQAQPYPYPPSYQAPPYQAAYLRMEPNRTSQRIGIYAELLSKTFLWGVGLDVNITSWLGIGAAVSYYRLFDWQLGLVAPYVNFYPVGSEKHALLIQAGPEIAFSSTGGFWIWSDYQDDSAYVFGQVTLAYEYRNHFMIRPGMTLFIARGGAFPWPGVSIGGAF